MKVIQLFKNETQLIKRAAKKDRKAQRELYEVHCGKMLSVCRQYIKDMQHAEEVMLNGFLKVFTHLEDFESKGSFEGWIRKIMIRESISFLRSQKKIVFSDEEIASYDFSAEMDTELNVTHIQNLIDKLPEGYRMVFVMYAVEGYKHAEIAKMLKITEGTSKSQLSKARKMLQQQLETQNTSDYGIK
ncbi:RNA polymerase sigma-70 factor (ECF subfamily) [Salegentibacter sp. 24]|uniref:RNA polymerase sigma factor n=1 Tax=Salegentibacter sp. 24 TaxID=2183986 RepID=UPI00105E35F1|nr:RNA polymerase sigma factor [Salegentibacter sp. 24]TDN84349.1 RNA polymerase sigma-70 factor (ECF subfamily) [Salegentibacter sp. 24]